MQVGLDVTAPDVAPTVIVVPCYNEADRIDVAKFGESARPRALEFLFVDDGSSDGTGAIIAAAIGSRRDLHLLSLPRNHGKGEAVRHGMRHALHDGAGIVGYYDADLAAPISELVRATALLDRRPDVDVLIGARVSLLGRSIKRSRARHYQGRVFASIASIALGLDVYDTQCGLKVFRATDALERAVAHPFHSRWAFDVELLGRLVHAEPRLREARMYEMPLYSWEDVDGSRLSLRQRARTLCELTTISADLVRQRRRLRQ